MSVTMQRGQGCVIGAGSDLDGEVIGVVPIRASLILVADPGQVGVEDAGIAGRRHPQD